MKIKAEIEAPTVLFTDSVFIPVRYGVPQHGEYYSIVGNANIKLCNSKTYTKERIIYARSDEF